ncbi:hypothetical protein S83_017469, partial [Arachis hypogaea]
TSAASGVKFVLVAIILGFLGLSWFFSLCGLALSNPNHDQKKIHSALNSSHKHSKEPLTKNLK